MTQARIGYGSLLKIGDANSPPNYTTVAEVVSVTPPSIAIDSVDATHSQSPGGWREFIPGLADGGEFSAELNFVPASASTLLLMNHINNKTVGPKQIEFPDGSTFTMTAFITSFEPADPLDDKMMATVTFKISGQPILEQAS